MDIFSCTRGAKVRGLGEGGSQPFALFAVSNIPLVRFQQFCGIFLTEIRCLQCLQITGIHLKHNFVSLFAGYLEHCSDCKTSNGISSHLRAFPFPVVAITNLI